jgi:ParB/RepB/Spo0J family partition protein
MGEINSRRSGDKMLGKNNAGLGRKKKRMRERDRAGPKNGRDHGFHVVATKDIKIKDLIIGKRFRQPPDDDVAKLAESLKTLGQTRAITVRTHRMDGKYPVIAGATLVMAAKMLKWTSVRADIVRCTDAQAHQWELAENLFRAHLTSLEEANHMAAYIRHVADPESVSRRNVANPKGGRPEGAITKAARTLPIKGKTEGARRKRIERLLTIASMLPESQAAAEKAGLDKDTLYEIAKEETAEGQLAKIQETINRKAARKGKSAAHGSGKKKTRTKRLALPSSLTTAQEKRVENLLEMWREARDLRRAFAKQTPAVHEEFFEKLRQSVAESDNTEPSEQQDEEGDDLEDEQEQEQENEQENEQESDSEDWD